jgi:hypothetical protein
MIKSSVVGLRLDEERRSMDRAHFVAALGQKRGSVSVCEEMDEVRAAWEEWATHEEARFMALDGQIVCFK